MTKRLGFSFFPGLAVTFVLFYLMQALIAGGKSAMTRIPMTHLVDFVRVKQPMVVAPGRVKPVKPPAPDDMPPPVASRFNPVEVGPATVPISDHLVKAKPTITGTGVFADGEYLPVIKVQPIYPQRALSRGLSGWVIVQFTVTAGGTVARPVVVRNCAWVKAPGAQGECHDTPNSVFDAAALRAAEKFKYKPRMIDGRPVDTAEVRNKISFHLVNGSHR